MNARHRPFRKWVLSIFIFLLIAGMGYADPDSSRIYRRQQSAHYDPSAGLVLNPHWRTAVHRVNKMTLAITNRGGIVAYGWDGNYPNDVFTGWNIFMTCEYPARSYRNYIGVIDLWVGGYARRGLIVSNGFNYYFYSGDRGRFFAPNPPGEFQARSITEEYGGPHHDAVSEEDFICEYTDTLVLQGQFVGDSLMRNPKPLNIKVTQVSHAWSYPCAEDIIFFELIVENIGSDLLRDVYIGLCVAPGGAYFSRKLCNNGGEAVGFLETVPSPAGCNFEDTLNMAWHADRDGNAWEGVFYDKPKGFQPTPDSDPCLLASARSGFGLLPLQTPIRNQVVNFNWWYSGGTAEPSADPDVPSYQPDLTWEAAYSDRTKYRRLSSRERDYPNYWTGVIAQTNVHPWNPIPLDYANHVASVHGTPDYLLSWGPITLPPTYRVPLTFALVGGENFHVNPWNITYIPRQPAVYERNLNFTDLITNALWAKRIYDNPGYDTDGDGYAGEYRVCILDSAIVNGEWVAQKADTQWYAGDGIADWRVAYPPTPPPFWLTPIPDGVHVRFNGEITETEVDALLQVHDFEGYRIYLGRDEREENLTLVASYDKRNYDKWVKNPDGVGGHLWDLEGMPLSLEEVRCRYAFGPDPCHDTSFHPEDYTVLNVYHHPRYPNDSIFRFDPHGYNSSEFDTTCVFDSLCSPIEKVYPNMPDPRTLPADSITEDMYTAEGHFKYFEYEFTMENLLPTVPYFINVTAYDIGSPGSGIYPLESDKTEGLKIVYPTTSLDTPLDKPGKVYVYPNPYRTDAGYRDLGIEGRNQDDRWDERVRAIWFANLPPKCIIKIFTLDGDLVRELHHDYLPTDPAHKRARWGLINRNQQKVETGLYYWTVEIPDGDVQMGKLAIIR